MPPVKIIILFSIAALCACARMGAPPGGPEDIQPPFVVAVVPRTDSTGVSLTPTLTLTFSEKVQKEQARMLIELGPGPVRLTFDWDGPTARLTPADSLRPDVTYRIRVRPGVNDMHRVKSDSTFVSYFSTGSQPGGGEITGKVTRGDTAVFGAVVRAAWMKDTTLVYDAYTDSSGAYRLPYLRTGGYRMLAFTDANNNRLYDYTREPGAKQLTSVVFEPVSVDFAIETADTTAPIFRSAEAADSTTVRLVFDDQLDTLQTLSPDKFVLRTPDSSGTVLVVDSVAVDKTSRTRLLLYPAQPLVTGNSYHVSVSGITNRAGLSLESASRSFTFTPPRHARSRGGLPQP